MLLRFPEGQIDPRTHPGMGDPLVEAHAGSRQAPWDTPSGRGSQRQDALAETHGPHGLGDPPRPPGHSGDTRAPCTRGAALSLQPPVLRLTAHATRGPGSGARPRRLCPPSPKRGAARGSVGGQRAAWGLPAVPGVQASWCTPRALPGLPLPWARDNVSVVP